MRVKQQSNNVHVPDTQPLFPIARGHLSYTYLCVGLHKDAFWLIEVIAEQLSTSDSDMNLHTVGKK